MTNYEICNCYDPKISSERTATRCLVVEDPDECLCVKFTHDMYNRKEYIECSRGALPVIDLSYLWQIYTILTPDIKKIFIFNGFYFGNTIESFEVLHNLLDDGYTVIITESVL